jgi:IPT/TIG domain
VVGISPGQGGSGGGTVVAVTGTGFVPRHTTVTIGGTTIPASAITVTSATTLTFHTPAYAAGPVTLSVSTPSGTSGPLSFTYLTAAALAAAGPPTSGLAILAGLLLATSSAVLVFTSRQIAARHRH